MRFTEIEVFYQLNYAYCNANNIMLYNICSAFSKNMQHIFSLKAVQMHVDAIFMYKALSNDIGTFYAL